MANQVEPKPEAVPASSTDISEALVITPIGGVHYTYGNLLKIDWTLHDVHIRVSELMHVTDPREPLAKNQIPAIQERASIAIPWHQAKFLRDQLINLVNAYEAANGDLKPVVLPVLPGPTASTET